MQTDEQQRKAKKLLHDAMAVESELGELEDKRAQLDTMASRVKRYLAAKFSKFQGQFKSKVRGLLGKRSNAAF